MASDNASEPRRPSKSQHSGAPPPEQEHLPCPRCDSTHTKFCYYNNYNFSQPRHFCKSCRRYWTQGGTLRDIPIGGGSRKNAKRSRTPSSTVVSQHSTQEHHLPDTPVYMSLTPNPSASLPLGAAVVSAGCDPFAKLNLESLNLRNGTVAGNVWHTENGEGGFVNGDCFPWPDLAISTPGNALK